MRKFVVAAGFLASLVLASNTYAGPFDTLVGWYDFKDDCTVSLAKCEESKLEAYVAASGNYFDPNVGNTIQIATEKGDGWVSVGDNLVAFDLSRFGYPDPVSYFAIKIGGGQTSNDLFVFKNDDANLKYAVVNLLDVSKWAGKDITAGAISHVAVPEPGSLLLIGVGALTAAAARRRQRSRQVISRA